MLLANQVATGLALTLFGLGLSSLIGQGYVGIKPPATGDVPFGPLADIPVLGTILFDHDPDGLYLDPDHRGGLGGAERYTRTGLILRAVGEKPRCGACARLQGAAHPPAGDRCSAARWRGWAGRISA